MTKLKLILVAAMATLSLMRAAAASPIVFTYIIPGASGTIGATPFTNQLITISAVADTANVTAFPTGSFGGFFVDNSSASVTIGSLGTFTFTSGTRIAVYPPGGNTGNTLTFARAGQATTFLHGDILIGGPTNEPLASWDLTTPIGPFTGNANIMNWNTAQCFPNLECIPPVADVVTDGGILVLTTAPNISVTFAAVTAPVFAGTPGKANCHGQSVSALAQQYGGLNNAAVALGYPSVSALQNAIEAYCEA
jgi:hypothetical protein